MKRMNRLADLDEFVRNHDAHGRLIADALEPTCNGYRLTIACLRGVVFQRWITPEDADTDLLRRASLN